MNVKGLHLPSNDYLIYDDDRLCQFDMSLDAKMLQNHVPRCNYQVKEHESMNESMNASIKTGSRYNSQSKKKLSKSKLTSNKS